MPPFARIIASSSPGGPAPSGGEPPAMPRWAQALESDRGRALTVISRVRDGLVLRVVVAERKPAGRNQSHDASAP